MRNFNHLSKQKETKFPWQLGLLKKNMSPRAFANPLTAYILFKAEEILVNAVEQINKIRIYFRP
ncbi:gp18 [Sphingomonas phage PAU]|uniref:gp18 n=1 Tax=Sphingomonas phage PAU TaxID=1150991 RepID=UPI0002573117|nr:gp18 [Sphingomonas phage PAU]AFF28016.1 gp18 [Sphingomonas phage PAU]